MTYFLVRSHGKQEQITRLHCTCQGIHTSPWSGKSTSGGGQTCQSTLNRGGRSSGGCSPFRESVETHWLVSICGRTRVQHQLLSCWHRWVFDIACYLAGGDAWQEEHDLQVRLLDTCTKERHAAQDDVGRYTQGNLQATLLNQVCNAWSYHLHRNQCNIHSQRWDLVSKWEVGEQDGVLCSAPLGLFAAAYPPSSEEYCSSWLESAGVGPLWRCVLRTSGGTLNRDCQLLYIHATVSCR